MQICGQVLPNLYFQCKIGLSEANVVPKYGLSSLTFALPLYG